MGFEQETQPLMQIRATPSDEAVRAESGCESVPTGSHAVVSAFVVDVYEIMAGMANETSIIGAAGATSCASNPEEGENISMAAGAHDK